MKDYDFRPLNDNEKSAVVIAMQKRKIPTNHPLYSSLDHAKVSYQNLPGGFCVCLVSVPKSISNPPEFGYLLYRGSSRRSYKDPKNPVRGEMLAFSRALFYSRPVELS